MWGLGTDFFFGLHVGEQGLDGLNRAPREISEGFEHAGEARPEAVQSGLCGLHRLEVRGFLGLGFGPLQHQRVLRAQTRALVPGDRHASLELHLHILQRLELSVKPSLGLLVFPLERVFLFLLDHDRLDRRAKALYGLRRCLVEFIYLVLECNTRQFDRINE